MRLLQCLGLVCFEVMANFMLARTSGCLVLIMIVSKHEKERIFYALELLCFLKKFL